MKILRLIANTGLALIAIFSLHSLALPQTTAPRQERLLNGLKILLFPDATAGNVEVKVRIHSGASFDPQGKEGAISLLAEALFPTDSVRDYFREDLGGTLSVISNYDYIQVNASSLPGQTIGLLEALSTALTNPMIDKETTARLKAARLAKLATLEADPAYIADAAIASRLFGTFPYGRPIEGTSDSVRKIEFFDLIDLRQRFLAADNATLAVSGNFNAADAYRAVRRLFGGWLKGDKKVPSTFRQPDPPPADLEIINAAAARNEFRIALRGVARSDKNYYAARALAVLLNKRIQTLAGRAAFVRFEARVLPGAFIFGVPGFELGSIKPPDDKLKTLDMSSYLKRLLDAPILPDEFDGAMREVNAAGSSISRANSWLDVDTYSLRPPTAVTPTFAVADVQQLLDKLKAEPAAYVLVIGADKDKTAK